MDSTLYYKWDGFFSLLFSGLLVVTITSVTELQHSNIFDTIFILGVGSVNVLIQMTALLYDICDYKYKICLMLFSCSTKIISPTCLSTSSRQYFAHKRPLINNCQIASRPWLSHFINGDSDLSGYPGCTLVTGDGLPICGPRYESPPAFSKIKIKYARSM